MNIPLEQLAERVHELPPRGEPLAVYDANPARLAAALGLLHARGFPNATSFPSPPSDTTGPSRKRLWRPNPFLVELIAEGQLPQPRPPTNAVLELACGAGRDAVFLAELGWSVTAVDVLPDALERGRALAKRVGVSVDFVLGDIETDGPPPRPPSGLPDRVGFDLVTVFFFLHRPLFPALRAALAPGGVLVYETFLFAHRDRFGKPTRVEHLLRPGELAEQFVGWETLRSQEGPVPQAAPTRITARLAVRRPS